MLEDTETLINDLYEIIERLTDERDFYRTKCSMLLNMIDALEKKYISNYENEKVEAEIKRNLDYKRHKEKI